MTRIILTRHGETIWNIEGKVQGMLDSPLTENGIMQAENLAKRLIHEDIDHLYSSDLPRAYQTAKIIGQELAIPQVNSTSLLREVSFGEWEGRAWRDIRKEYPEIFALWENEPHRVVIPGGDHWETATRKVWQYLHSLLELHTNQTICLVTHGLILKLIILKALGYEISEWQKTPWQSNTALNILEYNEGVFSPLILGDCGHLS